MSPFLTLITLKVVRKWWRPFFSIKIFKSRKAVMELFLSFRSFKSGKKVTESFFQWSRFFKLSYDAHISWNNIFSASSHWISLTIHFNLHDERCRAHLSKYCKSYFPTASINGFTHITSEAAVPCFPSYSCSEHFRKYWRKISYVSNDCLWKLYL